MSKSLGALATMGEALDEAVVAAEAAGQHVELPELDTTMALCMIRTHREPGKGGLLTVSAKSRVTGDIIVGPFVTREDEPSAEALAQLVRAHRWVLNPVTMGDGSPRHPAKTISGNPSICPINRIHVKCPNPKCGHEGVEWKDSFQMRNKEHNPPGQPYGPDTIGTCPAKNAKGGVCGTQVDHHKLFCTAFDTRPGRNDDPVIMPQQRDQVIKVMLEAWKAGPPADGKPTLTLPRIWAVYPLDAVPDPSWQPQDERALRLAERAAAFQKQAVVGGQQTLQPYPLGILPYGLAKKYHQAPEPISSAVKEFWLESDEVAMGWVSVADLAGSPDLGYKRELWSERPDRGPRQQSRKRSRDVYIV